MNEKRGPKKIGCIWAKFQTGPTLKTKKKVCWLKLGTGAKATPLAEALASSRWRQMGTYWSTPLTMCPAGSGAQGTHRPVIALQQTQATATSPKENT